MKRTIFIFVLALFATCSLAAAAQEPAASATKPAATAQKPAPANAPAQGSKTDSAFAPESANSNQELTHASNQAAGRTPGESGVGNPASEPAEEEAAFKFSPAVRGISRVTGLSLEGAYWLCVVINFGIVAVLIILAMKANLPAMFRGRTQEIQKGMEEARRSSEAARLKLQEIEQRLSRMSIEIGEMQKHAEAEGKAEEERIRSSIAEEKQKILNSADHEITQATSAARRDLQKYAVELAIAMAEKGIRVDTNEDKSLVEDFTEQLASEARRNGSS
jgi:F0F1-type ATP synthase membrane subunit b/b'